MTQSSQLTVEHVVVQSTRSYEEVKAALEGTHGHPGEYRRARAATGRDASFIGRSDEDREKRLGSSGFSLFSRVEQGQLLSLLGNPRKAIQHAIGNPLLAIQMISHAPEVALYAPLRLTVYESDQRETVVAYDRFSSLLAQYQHPEIARIAGLVEQKLELLVSEATAAKEEVAA